MDENTSPNSSENNAPTWADFKPPVMTTPFQNGQTLNVTPSEAQPVPAISDLTQGFQPESQPAEPMAAPAPVSPAVFEPVTAAPALDAPTTPQATPLEIVPTPPAVQEVVPPVPSTPNPVPSPSVAEPPGPTPVAPEIPIVNQDQPIMDPEHELRPPTPQEVANQGTSVTSSKPRRIGPLVIVAFLLLAGAGGVGYLYYSGGLSGLNLNFGSSSQPPATSGGGENLAILADSLGPDTWEGNFSNGLLATERGGLEFIVTDPPATSSAVAASASANAASSSGVPADLVSLKITISKVEVHLATQTVEATGTAPDATKSANKQIDRWETLRLNQNTSVDLLALRSQGGALDSLGLTYLAAGHYTEIRLYITAASGTTSDGSVVTVDIPGKNGIVKIVKPFDTTVTGAVKLMVDFDAPKSVVKAGDKYQLLPVVGWVLFQGKEI